MKGLKYFMIALIVIVIDQSSKLLVHTYMELHDEIDVIGSWFKIHYLLNPGMAFGFRWENEFGKIILTSFRIIVMSAIGYYLYQMATKKTHPGYLASIALILGGAVGNVIDSVFYGVLLQNHPENAATPWLHGQVIDMLFFPLFEFYWPAWVPLLGGNYFLFFSPVFNVADSSIFAGVASILLFQKKFFKKEKVESIPPPQPLLLPLPPEELEKTATLEMSKVPEETEVPSIPEETEVLKSVAIPTEAEELKPLKVVKKKVVKKKVVKKKVVKKKVVKKKVARKKVVKKKVAKKKVVSKKVVKKKVVSKKVVGKKVVGKKVVRKKVVGKKVVGKKVVRKKVVGKKVAKTTKTAKATKTAKTTKAVKVPPKPEGQTNETD